MSNKVTSGLKSVFTGTAGLIGVVLYIGISLFITGLFIVISIGTFRFVTNGFSFKDDDNAATSQNVLQSKYTSTEDYFSADFKYGPPDRNAGEELTVDGLTQQTIVYQSRKDDTNERTILVSKYTNSSVAYEDLSTEDLKSALQQVQSNVAATLKSNVINSQFGTINSKTALIATLDNDQSLQIIASGQRAYILYTSTTKNNEPVDFANSFRVL